jgi:hypothetical protein
LLHCYRLNTRNYTPLGIPFFKVGAYNFAEEDKSALIPINQNQVLGKAVMLTWPGARRTSLVAVPKIVLNEGHIDY